MIPDEILNEIIRDLVGDDVVPLVQLIKEKENVSEFKLADKLNTTVNHVRNMLYRLDEYSLVESTRKKDKKKGWYVYFWTLDLYKLKDLTIKRKKDLLVKLKERIKREETGDFFNCPDKHIRVSLENAMEYAFKCPECDLNLQREDNQKLLNSLNKQIEKNTQDINLLESLDIKPLTEKKPKEKKEKKTKKKPQKKVLKKPKIKKPTKKIEKTVKKKSKKKSKR